MRTNFRVTCNPLTSYGGRYSIGMAYTEAIEPFNNRCACWEKDTTDGKLLHFTFDVFSGQIFLNTFKNTPLQRSYLPMERLTDDRSWWDRHIALAHTWGDQLLVFSDNTTDFQPLWPTRCALAVTRLDPPPRYGIYKIPAVLEMSRDLPFRPFADDDFTVILGSSGYILWDFRTRSDMSTILQEQFSEEDWILASDGDPDINQLAFHRSISDPAARFSTSNWLICNC